MLYPLTSEELISEQLDVEKASFSNNAYLLLINIFGVMIGIYETLVKTPPAAVVPQETNPETSGLNLHIGDLGKAESPKPLEGQPPFKRESENIDHLLRSREIALGNA